jgi:hypothetical protein
MDAHVISRRRDGVEQLNFVAFNLKVNHGTLITITYTQQSSERILCRSWQGNAGTMIVWDKILVALVLGRAITP